MLEIKELCAFYGKKQVLTDISFNLHDGTLTAIVGKNGSGKTTLLSCIGGMCNCRGSIKLDGSDIRGIKRNDFAKLAAFLPQTLPSPHITVKELVMSGRSPYLDFFKAPDESDINCCKQAMEKLKITHLKDRFSDSISGGERQKAYLAMTLCRNTPLTLLDEPTTYMDISHANELLQTLNALTKTENKTVLCVMHDINLAVRYAQYIAVLDGGRCLFFGKTKELLEQNILESVFKVKKYCDKDTVFFA